MQTFKLTAMMALLAMMAIVFGSACTGKTGAQGERGEPGFGWGEPSIYSGSLMLTDSYPHGEWRPEADIQPGDRIEFSFQSQGEPVQWYVADPCHNVILDSRNDSRSTDGQAAFIAATSGDYCFLFSSERAVVISVQATIYPMG